MGRDFVDVERFAGFHEMLADAVDDEFWRLDVFFELEQADDAVGVAHG